jgi:hypothetical protein
VTSRNPWIDPRVAQVRPADARCYLLAHGWLPVTTANPSLEPFEKESAGGEAALVCVPLRESGRDYTQRIVELITAVALAEARYAVAVLDDILGQTAPPSVNGANADSAAPAAP